MRNKKEIHYPYYCKKCERTVYFKEGETINEVCTVCKNVMEKLPPHVSHTKDTLKNVNRKKENVVINIPDTKPIVTCPYCQSTNTNKISGLSKASSVALFGIFAMGKVSKQWHCNDCKSEF